MTQTKSLLYGFVILATLSLIYFFATQTHQVYASVPETQEYTATTTAANGVFGTTITGTKLIRTGSGALGSFVITGANTGVVNFYDATTTNVSLRTGSVATSSILLASFPASTVAGTYTLDVRYSTGLLIDVPTGTVATSTVTYR
jgi:hypothetical protein